MIRVILGSFILLSLINSYEASEKCIYDFSIINKNTSNKENYILLDKKSNSKIKLFEEAYDYSEGHAVVKENGKFGMIDINGDYKINPKYDTLSNLYDGLIIASKNKKYGFIDIDDKVVINFNYENIYYYINNLAAVKINNKWGFIDKSGKLIINPYYDYFNELTKNKKDSLVFNFKEEYARVRINGKWGLIDKTNNYYINAIYDEMNDSEEGFYFIELENNIGMMDYNGNIIHNPSFQEVSRFENNFAIIKSSKNWIYVDEYNNESGKIEKKKQLIDPLFGLINKKGKILINDARSISQIIKSENKNFKRESIFKGFRFISSNYKIGEIDELGNIVFLKPYKFVGNFSEGYASFRYDDNGKFGFINNMGEVVVKTKYDLVGKFSEGLATIVINRKYGFIDQNGKEILEPRYNKISDFSEGLASFSTDNLDKKENKNKQVYGYINNKGEVIIEPKFDEAESFIDGLAIVTENKLKGIINRNGDYIIKPSFNDIRFISNNIIEVKRNIEDNFGIINKEGNYLLEPKYCSIFLYSDEDFFSYQEGKFNQRDMRCNGNFGLIDKSGKIKINPIFFDIGNFYNNQALIIVKYKNKQLYGYLRKPECL